MKTRMPASDSPMENRQDVNLSNLSYDIIRLGVDSTIKCVSEQTESMIE